MSFKIKLQKAFPVFSRIMDRQRPLVRQTIVNGAVAGDIAVTSIGAKDELVSVLNMTDLTDVSAEFRIRDTGIINNAGGTSTATKKLLVTWHPWTE